MSEDSPVRLPRVMDLAIFLYHHEGISVPELLKEGFSKPTVYTLLTALEEHGIITVRPGKTNNVRGASFRRTFFLTPKGKSFAEYALKLRQMIS